MRKGIIRLSLLCAALLAGRGNTQQPVFGPADPQVRDPAHFDARRPVGRELALHVPDGFDVAVVGDLIISRPLAQYAETLPGFRAVLDRLRHTDVTVGNLETTIFDPRSFGGAPYSWDGDWSNASLPGVARDLRTMGFAMVARANNHVMDWGLEGMRETGRWLDDAGIVHAGVGETHGLSRAPQYYESKRGRVALVSIASTFRPTSESLPPAGSAPGRPGLSALHVTPIAELPPKAISELHDIQCTLRGGPCGTAPDEGQLFGMRYRKAQRASYQYLVDAEDRAEILRAVRAAKQNADLVVVMIHSHECSQGCDDESAPRGPGEFLKQLAHDAVDAGADVFAATGNHNLGPIEIYHSPARGDRPIFYGLGNFFWSDVQELLPHDLFQGNRELLARSWRYPERATEYDLTAPLNQASFAHDFTFQSVVAECQFAGGQLARVELRAIEEGYGSPLTESGIPRIVAEEAGAAAIYRQVTERTAAFGLPPLKLSQSGSTATIRP